MLKTCMLSTCCDIILLNLNRSIDLGVHIPHPQCAPGPNGQTIIGIVLFSKLFFKLFKIESASLILPIAPLVLSKRAWQV